MNIIQNIENLEKEIREDLEILTRFPTQELFEMTQKLLDDFVDLCINYRIEFDSQRYLKIYDELSTRFSNQLLADTQKFLSFNNKKHGETRERKEV